MKISVSVKVKTRTVFGIRREIDYIIKYKYEGKMFNKKIKKNVYSSNCGFEHFMNNLEASLGVDTMKNIVKRVITDDLKENTNIYMDRDCHKSIFKRLEEINDRGFFFEFTPSGLEDVDDK